MYYYDYYIKGEYNVYPEVIKLLNENNILQNIVNADSEFFYITILQESNFEYILKNLTRLSNKYKLITMEVDHNMKIQEFGTSIEDMDIDYWPEIHFSGFITEDRNDKLPLLKQRFPETFI